METNLEGRVRGNGRTRLHLAPEGLALTSVPGGDVKYASYDEVAVAETQARGRQTALSILMLDFSVGGELEKAAVVGIISTLLVVAVAVVATRFGLMSEGLLGEPRTVADTQAVEPSTGPVGSAIPAPDSG